MRELVAAIGLVVLLMGCGAGGQVNAAQEAYAADLRRGVEPAIKDAAWSGSSDLYVGVVSDGSARDGLARYVCESLPGVGVKRDGVRVKVFDVARLKFKKEWVWLGVADC